MTRVTNFIPISEIALIGSDDKDPRVTSFIPTGETVLTQTSTVKNNQRIWEKNEGEWTRSTEIRTRKKLLAAGNACMAIL